MTKEEAIKAQIKEIVANFDWARVHKIMVATYWKWDMDEGVRLPSIGEIMTAATEMMEQVAKGPDKEITSGGFTVVKSSGEGEGGPWVWIQLYFGLHSFNDGQTFSDP